MEQSFFQRIKRKFKLWLAWRLPDCRTITPTLGESLDRKLGFREKMLMKLHLFTCDKCARYLKQIKFLSDFVHEHEEHRSEFAELKSAELSGDIKEKLKSRLIALGDRV